LRALQETVMAAKAPKFYLELEKKHSKVFDAVEALGKATRRAGPLDDKTAHFVQLAAAAGKREKTPSAPRFRTSTCSDPG